MSCEGDPGDVGAGVPLTPAIEYDLKFWPSGAGFF